MALLQRAPRLIHQSPGGPRLSEAFCPLFSRWLHNAHLTRDVILIAVFALATTLVHEEEQAGQDNMVTSVAASLVRR